MDGRSFTTENIIRDAFRDDILSRDRELALARDWRDNGNQESLDALVKAYMRLVASVAGKYARYGLSRDDLVQEGVFGLLQAAEKFDPERGFRFGTYATWWVRAAIQRYMLDNWSIVRFATSHGRKKLFFELRTVMKAIEGASRPDDGPGFVEMAARELAVDEKEVGALMPMLGGHDTSLDASAGENGDLTLVDLLADEHGDVEASAMVANTSAARSRWLDLALRDLKDRDADIVRRRYLGEEKETLSAIATDLGITKERVRQLEARAMTRLRSFLEQNFPGALDEIISH
ncbi:MAG: RNA polymerase factor sigma-32 [Alphaproteobacteria bacterium]|nr:RNA polymerase factor sigma-32 [Alphaproteobacteria bacterium]|tara:strand:- start:18 stop:887 length:870 start_codon:yes stop_codon:yes gene_type:complete